jgi:hypothetical protein
MENLAYTAAEKRAIDAAHSAITYAADCWDWTAPAMLRDALKAAKEGGKRPITEAKAQVIAGFARGLGPANFAVRELYGLASGYRNAIIVGAGFKARRSVTTDQEASLRAACRSAEEAHEAALSRFLDRIRPAA